MHAPDIRTIGAPESSSASLDQGSWVKDLAAGFSRLTGEVFEWASGQPWRAGYSETTTGSGWAKAPGAPTSAKPKLFCC